MAQSVARRLGKAEVGGSSPLGSFTQNPWKIKGSFLFSKNTSISFFPVYTIFMKGVLMKTVKSYTIFGFFFVSLVGCIWHFVYGWSGNNPVLAPFFPINESTWEHMKLLFFPMLLFTFVPLSNRSSLKPVFFPAWCSGILIGTCSIPVLFYTYTGVLGFHTLFLDIALFFLSVFLAFFNFYRLFVSGKNLGKFPVFFLLLLFFLFIVFTYIPPSLPLFENPSSI